MIPRYSRPEMVAIWSPETKFRIWFEIEAHAATAAGQPRRHSRRGRQGHLGQGQRRDLRRRADRRDRADHQARRHRLPHPPRRDRRARGALRAPGHDVVGRARHDALGAAHPRRRPAARRPRRAARGAREARPRAQVHDHHRPLARHPCRADDLRHQARAGLCRVRAQPRPAERGARRDRASRHLRRRRHLRQHRPERRALRRRTARASRPEPLSTQIIPRDRHAMYFATLGVIASSIERLATEIRHLQRTEVLEAEEYFSPGQKGSSAMPHKRNPVLSENLTGLARLVRGMVDPGARERRPLARARHLAFLGRAHDRPGRDGHPRLRARAARPG